MKRTAESGQALVVVLLVLAVALTVTLYVLARSITDVTVSSSQEAAVRAFSAAEAGVERAIITGVDGSNPEIGNSAGYVADVDNYPDGEESGLFFNHPTSISSGEALTIWFVAHNPTTGAIDCVALPCYATSPVAADSATFLRIGWGELGTPVPPNPITPAIEITLFYTTTPGNLTTLRVARVTADSHTTRSPDNNFGYGCPTCTSYLFAGESYQHQRSLTLQEFGLTTAQARTPNFLQFMRVRSLYNTNSGGEVPVGVSVDFGPVNPLPSQGQFITSTGTSGESTRSVSVFQGWPEIPAIFENTIYSGSGIVK